MTKREAYRKDQQALQHRALEVRFGYRVGSFFKGCEHCGDTMTIRCGNGERRVWLSGYHVYRIYQPTRQGFMYWCYECGAKDRKAWALSDSNIAYALWLASHSVREGIA